MESYKVDSKLFIPLTIRQLQIKKVILVIMLIYAICVFIELLLHGFNPRLMGSLLIFILAVNIIFHFLKEGYQNKKLFISIGIENILLRYSAVVFDFVKSDMVITIPVASINSLEYSDKLNALRLVGPCKKTFNNQDIEVVGEWVVYIDPNSTYQVINAIEDKTKKQVKYLDR